MFFYFLLYYLIVYDTTELWTELLEKSFWEHFILR